MPRKQSLSRADFSKTRSFRRLGGVVLTVAYGPIVGRALPGGAVVVSKKVAKSAAVRNRLKRVIRPILGAFLAHEGAPSVVITVRKPATSDEVRREVSDLLARIA